MTGPRFCIPASLPYDFIPSSPPSPSPTRAVAETSDMTAQLKAQAAHLHELRNWANTNRGACRTCRWFSGAGDNCLNPTVLRGTTHPVSGEVSWDGPLCHDERSAEEYPDAYYNQPKRWTGTPLCGPLGLLWEERTAKQRLKRWALGGLNLLWIWLAGLAFYGVVIQIISGAHGH